MLSNRLFDEFISKYNVGRIFSLSKCNELLNIKFTEYIMENTFVIFDNCIYLYLFNVYSISILNSRYL